MKKVLSLMLVLAMVLTFAACGQSAPAATTAAPADNGAEAAPTEAPAEAPAEDSGKKLIAGMVFQEDQFFKTLSAGYQAAAADLGYEIQLTNTNNDQSKETDALNTYVAQGVQGVAISPLNTQVSPAAIEDAYNAGLKVAI